MDINLAKWKYAKIHAKYGGPIAKITCRESMQFGEKVYEAFADLSFEKTGFQKSNRGIYGTCDGSGTASTESNAIYSACSEALERWAWFSAYQDRQLRKQLSFDKDHSSTGFAAYPGLFPSSARTRAYMEAAERWSICAWWEGKISHELLNQYQHQQINGVNLIGGPTNACTVILWAKENGWQTYGFAASNNIENAAKKAKIELARNKQVIAFYEKNKKNVQLCNTTERRLAYYSSLEGQKSFANRVEKNISVIPNPPTLVLDREVTGPWSKYTTVWRCLFENKGLSSDEDLLDYFLF